MYSFQGSAITKYGSSVYISGDYGYFHIQNECIKVNDSTGAIDTDFSCSGDSAIYSLEIDENNLYLGGSFYLASGPTYVAPIDPATGNLVTNISFYKILKTIYSDVKTVISDGAGGIYVGGDFTRVNGVTRNRAAHIKSDGTLGAWNPNCNNSVTSLIKDGSNIYLSGQFTTVGGTARNYAAKVNDSTGTLDSSWNPNCNNLVSTMIKDGSAIYLGGYFTTVGGTTRNYAAKVNDSNAALDSSWNPNLNSVVSTIYKDGSNIYLGGSFTTLGGTTRNYAAKVNDSNATLDSSWNPSPNSTINSFLKDGANLYLGGSFTTIGGVSIKGFAKTNTTDATIDASWNYSLDASPQVTSIIKSGSYLYVAGIFTKASNVKNYGIIRIDSSTGVLDTNWTGPVSFNNKFITNVDSYIYLYGSTRVIQQTLNNGFSVVSPSTGNQISGTFKHTYAYYDTSGSAIRSLRKITNGTAFVQNSILNNIIRIYDTRYNTMRN